MFIGHFAVGFAAKRMAPRTSLTTLLGAAIFLDILWPLFLWLGLEDVRIDPGNNQPLTPTHFPCKRFHCGRGPVTGRAGPRSTDRSARNS